MNWTRGTGFRITGAVVRRFVNPAGSVAFLTLAVPGRKGEHKIDCRSFTDDMIVEIGSLGVGQIVEVTGSIDSQVLKAKDRSDVMVDGRAAWVIALTVKAIKVEGSSVRPKEIQAAHGAQASMKAPSASAQNSLDDDWK